MPAKRTAGERAFQILGLLFILFCVLFVGFIVYMIVANGSF